MTRIRPFDAVISDMDGVLTRTATLHERAWKQTFDQLLLGYAGQEPFSSADYRAYVDGKPRYDGVADFLASRRIDLPRGQPTDDPEAPFVIYIGDDETDEDAFAALAGDGAGIRIGNQVSTSLADYYLDEPDSLGRYLLLLKTSLENRAGARAAR